MARQVVLVVALILAAASASLPVEAKLSDNIVSQWVNEAQKVVGTVGIQNQLSAKFYGLVGLAIHRALSAGGAPPNALAAYAGHAVLSGAFPWNQGKFDALLTKQLTGISEADRKKASDVAIPIAVKLLKERAGAESTRYDGFKPAAPGTLWEYQFTPNQTYALYPQLANASPFFLTSEESDSIAYNKDAKKGPVFQTPRNDYQDTYKFGSRNSKDRKQYDTDSAFFWADPANTSAITGHWFDIAREVLPDLSLEDTALFFARAAAAAYDASITGWKVKYSVLGWRPITAFRQGYPGFTADPNWTPLLSTPAHPEYISGHQVSVGAILEVILKTLGGKDDVSFTINSEGQPTLGKRNYNSLTAAAKEVGDSRLYGGVHFRSANDDGLKLGRLVGAKVFDRIQPAAGSKAAGSKATTESAAKPAASGRRLLAWHFRTVHTL